MYAPNIGDITAHYLATGIKDYTLDLLLGQGALSAQINWSGYSLADASIFGFADTFHGGSSIFCGGNYATQPGTFFISGCDDSQVTPVATFPPPLNTVIMPGMSVYLNSPSEGKQLSTIAARIRGFSMQMEYWPEGAPQYHTSIASFSVNQSAFRIKGEYYRVNKSIFTSDSGSPMYGATFRDANGHPCYPLIGTLVASNELTIDEQSSTYGIYQSLARDVVPALQKRLTGGRARLIGVAGSCAYTTSGGITPNGNFDPAYFTQYTPAQVDAVAAAQAKLDAALSTPIDATYTWDDVILAANSKVRDEEVITDATTLVPYIGVAYDDTTSTGGTGW
jgi:hypothetical protein